MNKADNIKAVLIDDAQQARELIQLMLNELTPYVQILGEAENVDQGIELIRSLKPDVIFLDIKMPGKSGLELIKEIEKEEAKCEVIFTTAYNEYAIQAFKLSAIDYLLKPIQETELVAAVQKVLKAKELKQHSEKYNTLLNNLQQNNNGILAIPINYGFEHIAVSDIEFIEADRAYSVIHLHDGTKKLVSKNMGYFEDVLQHLNNFIKTHRSYLVSVPHVVSFHKKGESGTIAFKSGKQAEVSRSCKKILIKRLEQQRKN